MNVFVTGGTRVLGAEPVRGDLFDAASLQTAMGNAEAVLQLATRIPPSKRDTVTAIAAGLGGAQLQEIPESAVREAIGPSAFELMSRSQRVSNQRFKDATGPYRPA